MLWPPQKALLAEFGITSLDKCPSCRQEMARRRSVSELLELASADRSAVPSKMSELREEDHLVQLGCSACAIALQTFAPVHQHLDELSFVAGDLHALNARPNLRLQSGRDIGSADMSMPADIYSHGLLSGGEGNPPSTSV